jgi:putative permease
MTKQIIIFGSAVLTTILALVVFWQFRIVVIYVFISLMLAAALRPLVHRLAGQRFLVRAAWILLYLIILGIIGYLLFLISENVIYEIQLFTQKAAVQNVWSLPEWLKGSFIQQAMISRLPTPNKFFEAITGSQGQFVLPALLGFTQDVGNTLSDTIVIFFLIIYWSISQIHFERLWLSLLPSSQRRQARGIWRKIEYEIGAYIRGQVFQSFLAGVLFGVGFWLLGSPYPALLGLIGAMACLIPVVGAVLAVLPPLILGLLTSVQHGLFSVLYTLVVLIVLAIWIKPRFYNRKWDNPILTLVLLIALADAFGIFGVVLAPPLSIVCHILWNRLVSHRRASAASDQISDLKERQERVLENINAMDEPPVPLVTSSMERLTDLLEKAEPILNAALSSERSESTTSSLPLPEPDMPDGNI